MKLNQIAEQKDDEFANRTPKSSKEYLEGKLKSLNYRADLLLDKFDQLGKQHKSSLFRATGPKDIVKMPTQVAADPRKFVSFSMIHTKGLLMTKVWVDKTNVPLVRLARSLSERHNELMNISSEVEAEARDPKFFGVTDFSGSMESK